MWPSNPHFLSGPLTLACPSIRILGEEFEILRSGCDKCTNGRLPPARQPVSKLGEVPVAPRSSASSQPARALQTSFDPSKGRTDGVLPAPRLDAEEQIP